MSDDFGLSEELSTFFEDTVKSLIVEPDWYFLSDTEFSATLKIMILESSKAI